jgi:hypothetical protein
LTVIGSQDRGRGQVAAGEGRSAGVFVPAFDPGLPQGLLLASAGGGGIGGDHRAAGGAAQLPGGLARRSTDHGLLGRGGVLVGEPGDLVGDHDRTGHVDVPSGQRLTGRGQAAQRQSQVQNPVAGAVGQGEGGGDLGTHMSGGAGITGVLFGYPAAPQVSGGGQLQRRGPGRQSPGGAQHADELIVAEPG